MKFIVAPHKKIKKNVLFIQGFLKSYSTWNTTESGKNIGIENSIQAFATTIMIDFDRVDYLLPNHDLCQIIQSKLEEIGLYSNLTIVCHSYGSFIAIGLAELNPKIINGIVFIDPTRKHPGYLNYINRMATSDNDTNTDAASATTTATQSIEDAPSTKEIYQAKVINYDLLPDGAAWERTNKFNSVHLAMDMIDFSQVKKDEKTSALTYMMEQFERLEYWGRFTKKNIKSELRVYPNGSHMIHYQYGPTLIQTIRNLLYD